MDSQPFQPGATDDLLLAFEIERDAQRLGSEVTLDRYLRAIADPTTMPAAIEAAIEAALRAACGADGASMLDAAHALATRHPELGDAIHAVALGFGLPDGDSGPMEVGCVVLGRWRVLEILGSGATAQVARARDELLSSSAASVEAVIKRFEDGIGGDARLHAFREMRALVGAPAGLAARVLALHAPRGGAACIVTLHEPSREMRLPDDLEAAVRAIRRLHRAGFAHGDLKPAHVRIRPDGSVLLVDLGGATPATSDSCRQDLDRMLAMATQDGRGNAARLLARIARASLRNGPLVGAILLLSPRWRRRALVRGSAAAALAIALAVGWSAWRASTRQADALAALASSGRLVDATLDAQGRLIAMRLDVPEMSALHPDAAEGRVETGAVRFDRDGRVTILDRSGNPMSR